MGSLNHFHHSCRFLKVSNAFFYSFDSKEERCYRTYDFRPISLIGSVYKMIAKILAEMLKRVGWQFLFNILQQLGFRGRWLNWLRFCATTVRYSILVNGEPVGFCARWVVSVFTSNGTR